MGYFEQESASVDLNPGVERHPRLTYGKHVVRIDKVELKKLFTGGEAYIAEFSVMETTDPIGNPPGATRAWFQKMEQRKWAIADIGKLVTTALGYDLLRDKARVATELAGSIGHWMDASFDARQALKGRFVRVAVLPTKNDDGTEGYPKTIFSPASDTPPGVLPALGPAPAPQPAPGPSPYPGYPVSPPYGPPAPVAPVDPQAAAFAQWQAVQAAKVAAAPPVDPAYQAWLASQGRAS